MKRLPVSNHIDLRVLGKDSGFYSKWVEGSKQVVISSEFGLLVCFLNLVFKRSLWLQCWGRSDFLRFFPHSKLLFLCHSRFLQLGCLSKNDDASSSLERKPRSGFCPGQE